VDKDEEEDEEQGRRRRMGRTNIHKN